MPIKKRFNYTGVCISKKHYMVDISNKIRKIQELVENECYFTINRPRQYGKTTTLYELEKLLETKYIVVNISFEGIGDLAFQCESDFSKTFIQLLITSLSLNHQKESERLLELSNDINDINDLSIAITKFVKGASREVVLLIDEVDKSSNNQLFLSFIGMLRNKYLLREVGKDYTFKSVILVGVHDVKSLKLKIRDDDKAKYNSPWNIAVDFKVDLSFSANEISTMLEQYSIENSLSMDIELLSNEIYYYTGGYPFLVSKLCQIIDEIIYESEKKPWGKSDIEKAVKIILEEKNTLFDSMIKNLENNKELYDFIEDIIIRGIQKTFNNDTPLIDLGVTYGFFANIDGKVTISNKIFSERIYNYIISKLETTYSKFDDYNFKGAFLELNGGLNIEKILQRFMQFMKEQYSPKNQEFLEHQGRLLFLAFIKPIINGTGFDFKEVQVSEEKRLDVIITYNNFKYIIEMKIWRGQKYHETGITQLCDYLDIHNLDTGYLLLFDFSKSKEFKEEKIFNSNKEIFAVYV